MVYDLFYIYYDVSQLSKVVRTLSLSILKFNSAVTSTELNLLYFACSVHFLSLLSLSLPLSALCLSGHFDTSSNTMAWAV